MSRWPGRAAAALLAAALLAGCGSSVGRSAPSELEIPGAPAPTSGGATRGTAPAESLMICAALPAATVSAALRQQFDTAVAAKAGGTLLGQCDYTPTDPTDTRYQHVYVSARALSEYAVFVKTYAPIATTVLREQAAFGPTVGLLVKVAADRYFLQIVVLGADGSFLRAPAEALAKVYLAGL
jgi:hypothetical protein